MMKNTFSLMRGVAAVISTSVIASAASAAIVVSSGSGETYNASGLSVTNMYIGVDAPTVGAGDADYYAETGTAPQFTIRSDGTITVSDKLSVVSGRTLGIGALSVSGVTIDAVLGTVENNGTLNLVDINDLNAGVISSSGALSVDAIGAVSADQLLVTGVGNTTVTADDISVGQIQNGTGNMTHNFGDTFTTNVSGQNGVVHNAGGQLVIQQEQGATGAGSVVISGGIVTDAGATTRITAKSLSVGGDAAGAAITNYGNFVAQISGKTSLSSGLILGNASSGANTFSFETGTLDTGSLTVDFINDLNSAAFTVNAGDADFGRIVNAKNNTSASATITAQDLFADAIENYGSLEVLNIQDVAGGIYVSGAITGNNQSSYTEVSANDVLDVEGQVVNAGTMVLSSTGTTTLNGVSNTGNLDISASTGATGSITIESDVVNDGGILDITAREINIAGAFTNDGGTTTINGSDTNSGPLTINKFTVSDGVVNLGAKISQITVSDNFVVDVENGGGVNVMSGVNALNVGGDVIKIAGDLTAGFADVDAQSGSDMNVSAIGGFALNSTGGANIVIGGDVAVETNDANQRYLTLNANNVVIGGSLAATMTDDASAISTLELKTGVNSVVNVGDVNIAGGKLITHGSGITANQGTISIENGVWFDGVGNRNGLVVEDVAKFTLMTNTANGDADIDIAGGINMGATQELNIVSESDVGISGTVNANGVLDIDAQKDVEFAGNVTVGGALEVEAATVSVTGATFKNNAATSIEATGDVVLGDLFNNGTFVLTGANVTTGIIDSGVAANNTFPSVLTINATALDTGTITVQDSVLYTNAGNVTVSGNIGVGNLGTKTGDFVQGGDTGMFNLTAADVMLSAADLSIGGDFIAESNSSAVYNLTGNLTIGGDISVAPNSTAIFNQAEYISANDVSVADASSTLTLKGNDDITLDDVSNSGKLTIDAGDGVVTVNSLSSDGELFLGGAGLTSVANLDMTSTMLYQKTEIVSGPDVINILASDYSITAPNVSLRGINQTVGTLTFNTSDFSIGDYGIDAKNVNIVASGASDYLNAAIGGSIYGGTSFIGLEHMTVAGDYTFDSNSRINAVVLPYASGAGSTIYNYWADVDLNDGKIVNASDAKPLISVDGAFTSNLTGTLGNATSANLEKSQVGIDIFDIVDQGTAIWLLHAQDGVSDLATKMRDVNVKFCNESGTECLDYLEILNKYNNSSDNLPAYLTARDTNNDGIADSLYVVFDPQFGGPVEVYKIQPIVATVNGVTDGEYTSAGALDDLLSGQLSNHGFKNSTPIEFIPVVFKGSELETMANELYKRMEYYSISRDGTGLARFSNLFQPHEVEQIAGSVVLNEHTSFRDFEDRMYDEFIWNRNRRPKKAWLDVDFGMFKQDVSGDESADGNRFSLMGGFDWQHSNTLIVGLTGRISHMSGELSDKMDLGYIPGQSIAGRVDVDVADTNFGLGAYMMKTLGTKTRLYGNGFLDLHVFDVERNQTYVDTIDGNGTAFSLISEWGLMHDWLNQYIVGNIYARAGYNFGFSVREKVDGEDYMRLKSDGYFVLTPGYSLTFQKRIYPSAWFQMRPYASIGIEYDVLGAPDSAKYKFDAASGYTTYDVDINPLWANIGAGLELISATGIQVGLDYRYQHNSDIKMHNFKISGSYRF